MKENQQLRTALAQAERELVEKDVLIKRLSHAAEEVLAWKDFDYEYSSLQDNKDRDEDYDALRKLLAELAKSL